MQFPISNVKSISSYEKVGKENGGAAKPSKPIAAASRPKET